VYKLLIHIHVFEPGKQSLLAQAERTIYESHGKPVIKDCTPYSCIFIYDDVEDNLLNDVKKKLTHIGRYVDVALVVVRVDTNEAIDAYLIFDDVHKLSSTAFRQVLQLYPLLEKYLRNLKVTVNIG